MVLSHPDTSTAHAGESESFLSRSPSLSVLKKALFSFSSGADGVCMALEIYGNCIGTSVLQAKRKFCRFFFFFTHCIQMRDLNPWKIFVLSKI